MTTKPNYTITIDEGTTSTRALMISNKGEIIKIVQKEITQYYPKPGWVEHSAEEIWDKTLACVRELVKACLEEGSVKKEEVSGIAITNQRETTVIWDASTGKPINKAIVWQCRRTSEACDKLKKDYLKDEFGNEHSFENYVKANTGLIIDAYFSATKIKWLLDHHCEKKSCHPERNNRHPERNNRHPERNNRHPERSEGSQEHTRDSSPAAQNDNSIARNDDKLLFGNIDTWLIWNLTLGRAHLTDTSNASRTMLYDINKNEWDDNILKHLEIPKTLLPKVIESNGDFASTPLLRDLLDREVPIKAVLGDQQAAFYCYTAPGDCHVANAPRNDIAKATYGTGIFVMLPYTISTNKSTAWQAELDRDASLAMTNNERDSMSFAIETDNAGLVKTNAYKNQEETSLALEGSIFVGGSIVQWLRDELKIIKSSSEVEKLAKKVEDNGGVYIIPALAGLGAPHWKQDIRGAIFGLTRGSSSAHFARAALEAMAYSVKDVFEALEPKLKKSIKELNVDGGATKNDLLMQFQADLLGIPVKRYTETEMTALGVAKMTGDVELELKAEKIFKPETNREEEYKTWKSYLEKLL